MSELRMVSEGRGFHCTVETLWPTYLVTESMLDLADISSQHMIEGAMYGVDRRINYGTGRR